MIALGLVVSMAAVVAIAGRSGWYDEFYSLYVIRAGAPVGDLAGAWMRDNHPPLFYALAWLWGRLVAPLGLAGSVEGLRTINLVFLGGGIAALAALARGDAWLRGLMWPYAVALASSLAMVDRIDQLRSYFLSFVVVAVVVPMLATVGHGRRPGRALGLMLALAMAVHLVTTVIVMGLVGGMMALLAMRGRWSDARRLSVIGALASVPFALFMAVQLPTIMGNTTHFWIPGGPNAARWAIEHELIDVVWANPGLFAIAALGLALPMMWRGSDRPVLILTLGFGLALGLGVLFAEHLHRPIIITRYLVALDPVLAMMLALAAAEPLRRIPRPVLRDGALLFITAGVIHANLGATLARPGWDGTARAIAAEVRACPATRVIPALRWNANTLDMPPRENLSVIPFSYRHMAARWHFALASEVPHPLTGPCPTLFWAEHTSGQHPTAQEIIAGLRADGWPIASGRVVRIEEGWVLFARGN